MSNLLFLNKQERLNSEFAELNARSTPATREPTRKSLERDMEKFLQKGGKVYNAKIGETGMKLDMTMNDIQDKNYKIGEARKSRAAKSN
jgi:hypothetical protein